MNVVKMIAMIFLAIYLIVTGLTMMSEISLAPMAKNVLNLMTLSAGVLLLIAIGRFIPHKK